MKKKFAIIFFFLFILNCPCSRAQEVVGHFRQEFFSVRGDYYSGVYAVATPSHKGGAVLIRVHGKTVIDIIYIVVDACDLKAFIEAFESCSRKFLSNEDVEDSFFPTVSIMWRNRELHIWEESFGDFFYPSVYHDDGKDYLAFMGNVRCSYAPERQSGDFFLLLDGAEEIDSVLNLLKSPKIQSLISRTPINRHPFER